MHRFRVMSSFGRALAATVVAMIAASAPMPGVAQSISFIRDAEIEFILRTYATPIWEAAGLDPRAQSMIIVRDPSLNAFVAGGQRIFVHTGLLLKAERPSEVIGVLAHETGHIVGGHVIRMREEFENASWKSLATFAAGILAGIATGRADVGAATAQGGASILQRELVAFSRTQESSADQAGLRFLDAAGLSASGFADFMGRLAGQELRFFGTNVDPYVLTHPLSRERLDTIRTNGQRSPYWSQRDPPALVEMHERMQAKLVAYFEPPVTTLARYRDGDRRIAAQLARAIAFSRIPDTDRAVATIDALIAARPLDPFLLDAKADFLFTVGRIEDAIVASGRAVALAPDEPLVRLSYAQAVLQRRTAEAGAEALPHLQRVRVLEPDFGTAWLLTAQAYGLVGNEPLAKLSVAEMEILRDGSIDALRRARSQARAAQAALPAGSVAWLRAQDIIDEADRKAQRLRR